MSESYGEIRDRLARALMAVPFMTDANLKGEGRANIVGLLNDDNFDIPEPSAQNARVQCDHILDAVLGRPGALNRLAALLSTHDGSALCRAFVVLVDRELPEEYLTLREKWTIIDRLEYAFPAEKLGQYYMAIVGRDPTRIIGSVADLIQLVRQCAPDADTLDPLVHLTVLVAGDITGHRQAEEYHEMAEDLARKIDSRLPPASHGRSQTELLFEVRRTLNVDQPAGQQGNAYVVLCLVPYSPRPLDYFLLSSWLYYEDEPADWHYIAPRPLGIDEIRSEAIRIINDALALAEQRNPGDFDSVIEFILPRNQMNLPVESWSTDDEDCAPLGMQFAVVVRDLRRQENPTQRRKLKERWAYVRNGDLPSEQVITKWVTCTEHPFKVGELFRQLSRDHTAGVGLTFPPELVVHEFRVGEMLNSGMPVAVWPHSCDHMRSSRDKRHAAENFEFKEKFCQLSAGRPIRDLPQIVKELRIEITEFNDPTRGMALLWDDPGRIVAPSGFTLATPTSEDHSDE